MRKRAIGSLAVLAVAVWACTSTTGAGATKHAVQSGSPFASPPSSGLTHTCHQLPVVNVDPNQPAGFLDIAIGTFTDDPTARMTGSGSELERTGGSPPLVGWPVGWPYHADVGRWVPALPAWISPDGTRYLYPSYQASSIHMVDVQTGGDRVIYSGRRLYPVGWGPDGVYLMDWATGQPVGLYALSLMSGSLQQLAAKIPTMVPVHDGGAWESEVATDVPSRSGQNGPMANSLVRIDLVTGRSERWYSEANVAVSMLGFSTDGSPLLLAGSSSGARLLRISAPNRVEDSYPVTITAAAVTDSQGTWMIATDGTVLLYQPGGAPAAVGRGPAGLKPAGACRR